MPKYQALKRRMDKLAGQQPDNHITVSLADPAAVDRLVMYLGQFAEEYPNALDLDPEFIVVTGMLDNIEGIEISGGIAWPSLVAGDYSVSYSYAGRTFSDVEDLLTYRGKHE